jgi:hypothetical protein
MKPHLLDHHGVHGSFRDCRRSACGTASFYLFSGQFAEATGSV